jgi:hypothetical protein
MSSTDRDKLQTEQARAFFIEKLVPAAEKLRARGVRFFAATPEQGEEESWYIACNAVPDLEELDPKQHASWLKKYWMGQNTPELAELAEPLVQLARTQRPDEKASGEVSPLIYVMF